MTDSVLFSAFPAVRVPRQTDAVQGGSHQGAASRAQLSHRALSPAVQLVVAGGASRVRVSSRSGLRQARRPVPDSGPGTRQVHWRRRLGAGGGRLVREPVCGFITVDASVSRYPLESDGLSPPCEVRQQSPDALG